jgi:sugar phosphate isomerase/epimerase
MFVYLAPPSGCDHTLRKILSPPFPTEYPPPPDPPPTQILNSNRCTYAFQTKNRFHLPSIKIYRNEPNPKNAHTIHQPPATKFPRYTREMKSSRRTFLAASAAVVAASRTVSSAIINDPNDFKLGVATYSLRKFSREQAIAMLKQMSVRYVNIKEVHLPVDSSPDVLKAARKEFEDAGFVIEGGGNVSFSKNDDQDIRHKFEYAKLAGMPIIVCAPTHVTLPKMEKFVKEYDIKIAVHNHGPEDKEFPTPQSVLDVVKNMDPRCGLCIDCGHTARAGVDVVESIRAAGPRLHSMHIKDLADSKTRDSQCDVGEGVLPIVGIFKQLHKMRYTGGVMLEYEIHENDPLIGMQKSLAYMRGVMAGLKG